MDTIDTQISNLFLFSAVLAIVGLINFGLPQLVNSYEYNQWLYLSTLIVRIMVMTALIGLARQLTDQQPTLSKVGKVLAGLVIFLTVGLMLFLILAALGIESPIIGLFGISNALSSVLTFIIFGILILRSEEMNPVIGILLMVVALTMVSVIVGIGGFSISSAIMGSIHMIVLISVYGIISQILD